MEMGDDYSVPICHEKQSSSLSARLRQVSQYLKFVEDWSQVEKHFNELAVDGKLPKTHFTHCIGTMHEEKEFTSELFDVLARRRGVMSSSITKDELRGFWEQITNQSFDSRLQTFLDMVDKSTDGRISKEEVKEIIELSASTDKLLKVQERAEEYATLIMEELDPMNLGYIEIESLKMLIVQASEQYLTEDSKEMKQKLGLTIEHNPIKQCFQAVAWFIEDNWKRLWVMGLWILICAGLFTWKFIEYRHNLIVFNAVGYCVPVGKGCAETLKFNMALILLLVCRNSITWLRTKTKLGKVIPFDDYLNFHKVIAFGISIAVALHALLYAFCIIPRVFNSTDEVYETLKIFYGEKKPKNYWEFLKWLEIWTGLVMLVLMTVAYVLAQSWLRRNKLNLPTPLKKLTGFNSFWYCHHLFVIIYVLYVIHGFFLYLIKPWYKRTTWMYLAIPLTLYLCERLLRTYRSRFKSVRILKVVVFPGNVMTLHISKPQGFKYTSGQYICVNCPDVSLFQWHPFTITSNPEDDYISVHIQTLGDWTSQLKDVFIEACEPTIDDQSGALQIDMLGKSQSRTPRLLMDGPYGAPAQDYGNYEVLLLIGLGIGATPLISILKDILNNIKKQQRDLEEGVIDNGVENKKSKRAYFCWVTREKCSIEWFKGLMNEVAENDKEGVIELHNYCTGGYEEEGAQSALITMIQSLNYAKKGMGTRIKTYSTRPNWHDVFEHIALKHPNKRVGVFYCGTHKLVGQLRRLSLDFSRKTSTKFDFHKENF